MEVSKVGFDNTKTSNKTMATHQSDLLASNKHLSERNRMSARVLIQLEDSLERLAVSNQLLAVRNQQLAKFDPHNAELNRLGAERNQMLAENDHQIAGSLVRFAVSNQQLAQRNQSRTAIRSGHLQGLTQELADRTQELAERVAELAVHSQQISTRTREISIRTTEITSAYARKKHSMQITVGERRLAEESQGALIEIGNETI